MHGIGQTNGSSINRSGDFGQTLYTWGLGSGPYIVLPFFGPSDVRDAVGFGVDSAISPWQYLADMGGSSVYWHYQFVSTGMEGVTKREQNIEGLDALRKGSLDFYAQMRSVFRQYRDKQLGIKGTGEQAPKFEDYE